MTVTEDAPIGFFTAGAADLHPQTGQGRPGHLQELMAVVGTSAFIHKIDRSAELLDFFRVWSDL